MQEEEREAIGKITLPKRMVSWLCADIARVNSDKNKMTKADLEAKWLVSFGLCERVAKGRGKAKLFVEDFR